MSTCESVSAQRAALAVEALRSAGRLSLRVHGASMLPTLWPGDVVAIEACAVEDVSAGEIVLAYSGDRLFLHRFVAATDNEFLIRGDAMPGDDPELPHNAMAGRLTGTIRFERTIVVAKKLSACR